MTYKFKDKDIGKKVLLSLDVQKLDNYFFEKEEGFKNIPYDAIIDYKFLTKIRDKPKRRIIDREPIKRKINLSTIIAELRVDEVYISGDIVEVKEDYLKIKR
jgi:hypothetical protein